MKDLHSASTFDSTEGSIMKRLKKFTQVDLAGNEGLYETTIDRWSKHAKHQLKKAEIANVLDETVFDENETVMYEGQPVLVKVSQGPRGTVGIIYEGHLKMVKQSMLTKIEEGVMGGVQTMTPINRIMQLAGLEHTGATTVQLEEDVAGTMFNQLLTKNQSDPKYKNNPDAAKLATVGQVLAGLQAVLSDIPTNVPANIVNQLKAVPGIGASLITTASEMTKPLTGVK